MHIAKRFGFYGFGFIIGLVLLFFFLNGKKLAVIMDQTHVR